MLPVSVPQKHKNFRLHSPYNPCNPSLRKNFSQKSSHANVHQTALYPSLMGGINIMQQTNKYKFNLIEGSDDVSPAPLNENMEKVETRFGAVEAALADGLAAVEASLGTGGKTARIALGKYTGNGRCGAAHPNSLTFDFAPKVVFVARTTVAYGPVLMVTGGVSTGYCQLTWSGNRVSWYDNRGDYATATEQLNDSGVVYSYVAIGC